MQKAFKQLEAAISKRFGALKDEITLLSSVKELLEGELGSASLQREMLGKDLTSVSEEHEALKAAYHALETESITLRRNNRDSNNNNNVNSYFSLRAIIIKISYR